MFHKAESHKAKREYSRHKENDLDHDLIQDPMYLLVVTSLWSPLTCDSSLVFWYFLTITHLKSTGQYSTWIFLILPHD